MTPHLTQAVQLKELDIDSLKWVQTQLNKAGLLPDREIGKPFNPSVAQAFAKFKALEYQTEPDMIGPGSIELLEDVEPGEFSKHHTVAKEAENPGLPKEEEYRGRVMTLPHGMGKLQLDEPVKGSQNFKWVEFVRTNRVPENSQVVQNIIKMAKKLEEVKTRYGGKAVTINSGYRPYRINLNMGGAPNSRHIQGDAVDIVIAGVPPVQVARELNAWWGTQGGIGIHHAFTHLDLRGYHARWLYPGSKARW